MSKRERTKSKNDHVTLIVDAALLLSFISDAAVQCHDRSDDTVNLLRRLCLGRLDVAGRVCVHDYISCHPCHDRIASVDDVSFHQELVKLFRRRRHILEALSERYDRESHPLKVLGHLHRTPAVKGDL